MQLRVEFALDENPEEEYSDEEKFVYEEEIDGVLFLYGDAKVDPIFFEDDSDNLNERPKFDDDGRDFVEDKVVFGKDDFVIEVVSQKNSQVLEVVVGDMIVNKSYVKDFSDLSELIWQGPPRSASDLSSPYVTMEKVEPNLELQPVAVDVTSTFRPPNVACQQRMNLYGGLLGNEHHLVNVAVATSTYWSLQFAPPSPGSVLSTAGFTVPTLAVGWLGEESKVGAFRGYVEDPIRFPSKNVVARITGRRKMRSEASDEMMIFHMVSCVLKMFGSLRMRIQGLGKERHQSD
ncbi:hypothetical protein Syun_023642 [Stephania yunnanensis]|uniref:Uncharacterized protein n=1 Tax=Stephania yunnanensis TaxID=152371 RepID=A0AAP0F9D4_9MAGN